MLTGGVWASSLLEERKTLGKDKRIFVREMRKNRRTKAIFASFVQLKQQAQIWEMLVGSHGAFKDLDCVQEQDTTVMTSGGKPSGSTNKMAISILRTLFPKFHPLKEVQLGCQTLTDSHPVRYKLNFPFTPVSTTLLFYVISAAGKKKKKE